MNKMALKQILILMKKLKWQSEGQGHCLISMKDAMQLYWSLQTILKQQFLLTKELQ